MRPLERIGFFLVNDGNQVPFPSEVLIFPLLPGPIDSECFPSGETNSFVQPFSVLAFGPLSISRRFQFYRTPLPRLSSWRVSSLTTHHHSTSRWPFRKRSRFDVCSFFRTITPSSPQPLRAFNFRVPPHSTPVFFFSPFRPVFPIPPPFCSQDLTFTPQTLSPRNPPRIPAVNVFPFFFLERRPWSHQRAMWRRQRCPFPTSSEDYCLFLPKVPAVFFSFSLTNSIHLSSHKMDSLPLFYYQSVPPIADQRGASRLASFPFLGPKTSPEPQFQLSFCFLIENPSFPKQV